MVFYNRVDKKISNGTNAFTLLYSIAGVDDNGNYAEETDAHNTPRTGQIKRKNTAMTGKTAQWITWKQNLITPTTETKIPGQMEMMRQPFLSKLQPKLRQKNPRNKPQDWGTATMPDPMMRVG